MRITLCQSAAVLRAAREQRERAQARRAKAQAAADSPYRARNPAANTFHARRLARAHAETVEAVRAERRAVRIFWRLFELTVPHS